MKSHYSVKVKICERALLKVSETSSCIISQVSTSYHNHNTTSGSTLCVNWSKDSRILTRQLDRTPPRFEQTHLGGGDPGWTSLGWDIQNYPWLQPQTDSASEWRKHKLHINVPNVLWEKLWLFLLQINKGMSNGQDFFSLTRKELKKMNETK